jgi:hypothetical protein
MHPDTPYVDAHLGALGRRWRRLVVDDEGLSWGKKSIRFADVTALSYWQTTTTPEVIVPLRALATVMCQIDLYTGKKRTSIAFRARSENEHAVFERTVAILDDRVAWRLVDEILAAIEAGQTVKVARFRLSREGLRHRRRAVPWESVIAVRPPLRPNPDVPMGGLIIYGHDGKGGAEPLWDIFIRDPNSFLMPMLVDTCVERYARAPANG